MCPSCRPIVRLIAVFEELREDSAEVSYEFCA